MPAIGDYSTSEQDTGFTWIDGKHIYKKTVNFGALPNATAKAVNTNISNMDYLISFEAVATNGVTLFIIPSLRPLNASLEIGIWFSKTQVTIETGNNRSDFNAYITLYYTKAS